jgi:hypothetical protein
VAEFKKLLEQYWQIGLVVVVTILLLTIVSATGGDARQSGSTYSNAPDGYSAWYQMEIDRGTKIRRWQKSFKRLTKNSVYSTDVTLLQVNSQLTRLSLSDIQKKWIEQGNKLVILGVNAPAENVPFSANLESSQGSVKIETKRRFPVNFNILDTPTKLPATIILRDRSGSVINEYTLGKGRLIVASTNHLAANAYQDIRPNYELLSKLVQEDRQQLMVDEYIHGHRDRHKKSKPKPGEVRQGKVDPDEDGEVNLNIDEDGEERTGDIFGYFANTPLIIVLLNLILGILVSLWQQNRRFGRIFIPKPPQIENSEAYIQALGGVLQQANSSEFVIQNIGRAEQLSWQKKLGLGGDRIVESDTLITAWENRTKLPTDDLRFVLKLITEVRRLSPIELNTWLIKLQAISRQLG